MCTCTTSCQCERTGTEEAIKAAAEYFFENLRHLDLTLKTHKELVNESLRIVAGQRDNVLNR